jgi:hypothetical protein
MLINKIDNIEYFILDDIGEYLEESAKLIVSGGQWSDVNYIKTSLLHSEYFVIAVLNGKLIGVSVAKNKIKYKDIIYCVGGLLSVDINFRKLGVATNLLKFRNDAGSKYGINLFLATINPNNKGSITTVTKLGYEYWNDIYYSESFYEKRYYKLINDIDDNILTEMFGDKNY